MSFFKYGHGLTRLLIRTVWIWCSKVIMNNNHLSSLSNYILETQLHNYCVPTCCLILKCREVEQWMLRIQYVLNYKQIHTIVKVCRYTHIHTQKNTYTQYIVWADSWEVIPHGRQPDKKTWSFRIKIRDKSI